MIKSNKEFATGLLSLAKQTKNYSCLDNKAFLEDVDAIAADVSNKKLDDSKYLLERIDASLTENYDRRSMAGYNKLNELKAYIESI